MLHLVRFRHIAVLMLSLKIALVTFFVLKIYFSDEVNLLPSLSDTQFWFFVLAGFVAQMIDGALGMAYGVSCSTLLLSFGLPPALASASVHTAEVFTTGASGLSHLYLKNVNKSLFFRLAFTGIVGAVLGAFLISEVFDGKVIKPYVAAYLLILGVVILVKSFRKNHVKKEQKHVEVLGFFGGLLDSIGGGGWGPIVTSNLIQRGESPQETIGTVNTAEFFVTFFSTGVFLFFVGVQSYITVLGLILGGILAAPIGAYLTKWIKPRTLMFMVGCVIIITSIYTIVKVFI